MSGPSGEVDNTRLKEKKEKIDSKLIINFRGIFTCMLYVMQMVTGKQTGDGSKSNLLSPEIVYQQGPHDP